MTPADVRRYVLGSLEFAALAHEREADSLSWYDRRDHEAAAHAHRILHEKVEGLPEDHPAFVEMAAIAERTDSRCQRKDAALFERMDYAAKGYATAAELLDAMLINWRRIDRQETAAKSG